MTNQEQNNSRSVITINPNAKPNILKEKITLHVLYFTDETEVHSKGLDITATSWETCIRKFNKMKLGKAVMMVEKEFTNNINRK